MTSIDYTWKQPRVYAFTSTKEYVDAFPVAYRQWRADSHCNLIHGYAFSMKFYFGTNDLDVRNWAADYGGLKELKEVLQDQFDHTLLVAQDDPELETFKLLQEKKLAKLTILPRLGCEGLACLFKFELSNLVLDKNLVNMLGFLFVAGGFCIGIPPAV